MKQYEVVQGCDSCHQFYVCMYPSKLINWQAYIGKPDKLILEEGFVQASHYSNGQVMISWPRMLDKQVLGVSKVYRLRTWPRASRIEGFTLLLYKLSSCAIEEGG